MQRVGRCWQLRGFSVSILTRPGGRVQLSGGGNLTVQAVTVSILTRPGGRVQLRADVLRFAPMPEFQSSPVPEDGCNADTCRPGVATRWFQSSPVPEDGCNVQAVLITHPVWSFNPHPSRRTGATAVGRAIVCGVGAFQSSPVPEDGCNFPCDHCEVVNPAVSILTRPGGRVQHTRLRAGFVIVRCFNPHPSRRTGATTCHVSEWCWL